MKPTPADARIRLPHDWYDQPLPANVVLGERSWLYSAYAFIHYHSRQSTGVRVGRDSGLYDGTLFDLGRDGRVEIGDFCTVVGATFATNAEVRIGDYVLIAHEVVIAGSFATAPPGERRQSCKAPPDREIVIGDDCWIGARAVILGGSRLGRGVIVGAGTVVDGDVPDYGIVAGNPARVVGWARPST